MNRERRSTLGKAFDTGTPVKLFISFMKKSGEQSNRTLRYKAQSNGFPYYTDNKDTHLFLHVITGFGSEEPFWVICRKPAGTTKSGKEPEGLRAKCRSDGHKTVPYEGWEYVEGRYGEVAVIVSSDKPAGWIEKDDGSSKVPQFLAALGKDAEGPNSHITVRDLLRNLDVVEELLPELLTEFPKVDRDGNGVLEPSELEVYFAPQYKKEYSKAELNDIWQRLVSQHPTDIGHVTLKDMRTHYKFIDSTIPELIDKFSEIDADKSCTILKGEFFAFFGDADIWLDTKLSNIIGLANLKQQIRQFYWSVKLDRMRREAGHFVNQDEAIVVMFKGNPGVGKTTFGRLIAQLLNKIALIPTDTFIEAQRDQLVGSHIGETEKKTEELIAKAHGGVLFVDEAYRLNVKDSEKDFGKEAINALMKAMTVKGKVIVLAGYPREMDDFVAVNPGIQRRITYTFVFEDYTSEDLARILQLQVAKRGFSIDPSVELASLTQLLERETTAEQRISMNGGMCEHIARNGIIALNETEVPRIRAEGDRASTPSVVLQAEHLVAGCRKVPRPVEAVAAAAAAATASERIPKPSRGSGYGSALVPPAGGKLISNTVGTVGGAAMDGITVGTVGGAAMGGMGEPSPRGSRFYTVSPERPTSPNRGTEGITKSSGRVYGAIKAARPVAAGTVRHSIGTVPSSPSK